TELRLIVVDPDAEVVSRFRERLRRAGVDGKRVSVLQGTPRTAALPPYLAVLSGSESGPDITSVEDSAASYDALFQGLRPSGGAGGGGVCVALPPASRHALKRWLDGKPGEGQARVDEAGELVVIRRDGPLPGSANWTHEHADAANTRVSRDRRVKAPLGLLWF